MNLTQASGRDSRHLPGKNKMQKTRGIAMHSLTAAMLFAMASAAQMLTAGAVLVVVSLLHGEQMSAAPSSKALLSMAYLVVFGSFIAYSAYLYLLKTVRPALATSYALVNPLVAMALGAWLAGERFGVSEMLALLAILGGVLMVLTVKSE